MTRSNDLEFVYHHSKVHPEDEPSLLRWYASIDPESRLDIWRSSAQVINKWMRLKDFQPHDQINLQYSALIYSINLEQKKKKSLRKKVRWKGDDPDGKILDPKAVASGSRKKRKAKLKDNIDHRLMLELKAFRHSEKPKVGFRRMARYVKKAISKEVSHVYLQKIYEDKFGKD
jgi:hypothetical protein